MSSNIKMTKNTDRVEDRNPRKKEENGSTEAAACDPRELHPPTSIVKKFFIVKGGFSDI